MGMHLCESRNRPVIQSELLTWILAELHLTSLCNYFNSHNLILFLFVNNFDNTLFVA